MVTDASVRAAPPWWAGVFEKVLLGYPSRPVMEEPSFADIDRVLWADPRPTLAWFPTVMENLERLPWGADAWSSEGARPLDDGAVVRLLLLLQELFPADGPAPAISPTWDGGVQADWELGDTYLEIEIMPGGMIRCCFVDERGDETIEEEFELAGREDTLRSRMKMIAAAS